MNYFRVFKTYSKEENIIAFAVMSQPALVVFQFLLISVFYIPEEQTTKYRVALTAIPLLLAIMVGIKKKPRKFIWTFVALFFFLIFEYLLFPANGSYIFSDSLRFLVPVIVPSILCLSCLRDMKIVEDVLFLYSWIIVFMALFFVMRFLQGRVEFESYNMGLSYALLLPMVILYKNGGMLSYIGTFICFICILVFGSRGALIAGVLYILYDIVKKNKRNLFYIAIASFFVISMAISFGDYLESLGISSRTLNFIIGGNLSAAEGRDDIYPKAIALIQENWFFGLGIYGDRVHMDGEYCHNVILEFLLDYGVIFGSLFLIVLFVFIIKVYIRQDSEHRNALLKYFIVLFLPLFTSGSYLIECNMGVFWGIVFLLNNYAKDYPRKKLYQYKGVKESQKLSNV